MVCPSAGTEAAGTARPPDPQAGKQSVNEVGIGSSTISEPQKHPTYKILGQDVKNILYMVRDTQILFQSRKIATMSVSSQLLATETTSTSNPKRPTEHETNNTFVLSPAREFSYEETPIPELRTSRDVRVRVIATGLCGSDVGDR